MNVSKILSNHINDVPVADTSQLYTAPNIQDKKLNNAIKAMDVSELPTDVRAIVDTTLFHNAKTGILFTSTRVYFHESLEHPISFEYQNIAEANYSEETKHGKSKEKVIPHINLSFIDETESYSVPTAITEWVNSPALASLLDDFGAANDVSENENTGTQDEDSEVTSTIYSLEDLPSKIKLAYAELLCNFALHDDHVVDANEYRSIISFAVRINLPQPEQLILNNYLIGEQHINSSELLDQLHSKVSDETSEILNKSLMKDLLSIVNQKQDQSISDWKADTYLCELAENLELTDNQVDVLVESIQHDQLILDKRLNDTQIKKQTKDLAAKAAAVGIPLTALYFSGTVGVSAAGITSALATLGFGGILGLSGMVSGIGILILAGTATYKGVEHFTGRKDVENNKQREALLQQIIRNTQRTLNYLIKNVNEVSRELIEETQSQHANRLKIKKLIKQMAILSKGAQTTTSELDHYQSESILTNVPMKLDVEKLAQLTREPTLKKYYDIVLKNYEKDADGSFMLKASVSSDDATTLTAILSQIGYFTIKGVAKSGLGSATSALKGMFD